MIKDIIGGHHIESVRERIRKSSALGHADQKKIEINSDIYNFREIKNAKIQLRKYCFDEHQSMVDAEARRDNVSDERWRRDFGAPILSGVCSLLATSIESKPSIQIDSRYKSDIQLTTFIANTLETPFQVIRS